MRQDKLKLDKMRQELARTREKAAEWQARVREMEQQVKAQENLEIVQAVRSVAATPEDLKKLLDSIKITQTKPQITLGSGEKEGEHDG